MPLTTLSGYSREAFQAADVLLAVSGGVAEYLRTFSGVAAHVHVVPNGVNANRFLPHVPRSLRKFTIGFVGTLRPWHGMSLLGQAFSRFHAKHPHAELLIVGDGPASSELIDSLNDVALSATTMTGHVRPDEVPRYLQRVDVAVAPYSSDQPCYFSPLKIFEYMAASVPVVASRVGDIPCDYSSRSLRAVVPSRTRRSPGSSDLATSCESSTGGSAECQRVPPCAAAVLVVRSGPASFRPHGARGVQFRGRRIGEYRMSRRKQKLQQIVPKLRQVYAYFWPDIAPQRRLIAGSLLALLGSVFFGLLEPWPLKIFIDNVLPAGSGQGPATNVSPLTLLLTVAVAMVVIAALRGATDYISRVGFFIVGNRVVVAIRDRVFRHLQDLSLAFHTRARTGDLIVRLTRDVSLLRDVTATAMLPLLASCLVLVGMVAVMFWLQWKLALLALATLPLFWLATVRIGKRIRATARRQRQREGAMATTAAEAMGAITVVKALGLESHFAQMFGQRNNSAQKEDMKASRLSVKLSRTVDLLLAVSSALVMWFGGKLALEGHMSAGDLVVFLTYLKRSFKPAQEFAKYIARMAKAAAAGERIIDLLEQRSRIPQRPDARVAEPLDGHIRFRDVHFGFDADAPVLRGVNLDIAPGEMVALIGPSGSGKSTAIGHILRLFDPQSGSVSIDGIDIREFALNSLRAQMATVMQDALLLAASVWHNIAIGRPDATDQQVLEAAQLANADHFIRQMSHGYDSVVGERGGTLSRGQRQRIAIARAAIRQAPILLLDEPTTGLDEDNERAVIDALLKLARNRTTILVTHSLALAARADRIAFLDAGEIVEQGTHEELRARGRRYADWLDENLARRPSRATAKLSVVAS